jgi:AcrR family transcriptional regulator
MADRTKVVSRRMRPAKSPLSLEVIISTALDVLAKDGTAGLSLRRVATALDTGPASLYVYLENLDELHALMVDQALAAVRLPKAGGASRRPWSSRLKALLRSYFSTLCKRPGLAELALSTIACGPNSIRIWERLLDLLKEGGVDDTRAAWGVDLLTLYVTAIAAEQSHPDAKVDGLSRVKKALSTVSADAFPLVFAFREALTSGSGEARSDWALDVIIGGIAAQPRTKDDNP